jgi:RNA polymerase primary sigma factor
MASESVAWTLKRMAESPLLTAQQELILGRHTQRLGAFEAERAVLKTVLDREPTMGEWAAACNYTATAFAAKQQQNVLKAQRAAAAAAAAAAENNEEPLPAPPVPPPREMTDALALKAFDSDLAKGRRAKEQLVNSNMRLVVSIARRYQSLGVGLQDLIQEGSLGLIRAAEKCVPPSLPPSLLLSPRHFMSPPS